MGTIITTNKRDADLDAEIAENDAKMAENDAMIKSLRAEIANNARNQVRIKAIRIELEKIIDRIKSLQTELVENDGKQSLRTELKKLDARIKALRTELEELRQFDPKSAP